MTPDRSRGGISRRQSTSKSFLALLLAVVLIPTPALASAAGRATCCQAAPVALDPQGELERNIAQYQRLAEDLTVTIAQTEIIQRQIDSLQQQIAQRRATVGRIAAVSYRTHRPDAFRVLIDASSTDEVLRHLLLVTALTRRQQHEIQMLGREFERYESARRTLETLIDQQRTQQRALVALRTKIQTAGQPAL